MKCIASILIGGLLCMPSFGQIVTPTSVIATSEFGAVDVFGDGSFSSTFATNLIDGSGLVDETGEPCMKVEIECLHDFDANSQTMWVAGSFSAGIPGGESAVELDPPNVDEQILEFDLGRRVRLSEVYIWQQNQGGAFGALAPRRGVEEFDILVSPSETGDNFVSLDDEFILESELGEENVSAQRFFVHGAASEGVRRVRFNVNSVTSPDPLPEEPHPEFEFVGLSEVRFLATLPGDANLNWSVEFADFLALSKNFGQPGTWETGDFDFDGQVAFPDFLLMSSNFGKQAVGAQSVPEPVSNVLAIFLLVVIPLRRSRRWCQQN